MNKKESKSINTVRRDELRKAIPPKYPDDFKDFDGVDLDDESINELIQSVFTFEYPYEVSSSGNIMVHRDNDNMVYVMKIMKVSKEK